MILQPCLNYMIDNSDVIEKRELSRTGCTPFSALITGPYKSNFILISENINPTFWLVFLQLISKNANKPVSLWQEGVLLFTSWRKLSHFAGDARRSIVFDTDITQPHLTLTEQNREYSTAERAAMLCVLSIQNDTAKNINLSAAVQDFAKAKARIVTFQETTQKAHCFAFHSLLAYINIHTHTSIQITAWQITAVI